MKAIASDMNDNLIIFGFVDVVVLPLMLRSSGQTFCIAVLLTFLFLKASQWIAFGRGKMNEAALRIYYEKQ